MSHHVVITTGNGDLAYQVECQTCGYLSPSVPEHVAVSLAAEHLEKEEES